MNIDHIEAFLYVVHYKSTHKAASALFLSQPTVTARIKSLERELGVELFY
ncbi:LysR family transcriptional regulator [Lysinibacillus fusiformis]|nr:LysR family transcriptional regulator [Lysinibacillus fusiformis]SCX52632.1 regulatory helix-turn-helix protein, lysR family [Lysinibacillus fusiformis]SDB27161.1 regulatory helix-turn-helix protein, lysR family [Lysinibacillus fusiformis]SFI20172.1 regulatory helix-turn-helix protein, lysR family [Lysinibacillus fusiformis]SFS80059.1 regulatory helix-turn-helix protein, lysR family [Lysinibacillus fusiformis]